MAVAFGVVPVNTIEVDTASLVGGKNPVGYVQSIAADGAVPNMRASSDRWNRPRHWTVRA
jgi:hypothetical protein